MVPKISAARLNIQHHAADDDTERKTESSTEALSTFPSIQLIHYIEEERRMIA
jgi:hypothetical protein